MRRVRIRILEFSRWALPLGASGCSSSPLRRSQEIAVFVGPLDPGSYEFFDDFHLETRGHLVVK
jgi:hypothetical protein